MTESHRNDRKSQNENTRGAACSLPRVTSQSAPVTRHSEAWDGSDCSGWQPPFTKGKIVSAASFRVVISKKYKSDIGLACMLTVLLFYCLKQYRLFSVQRIKPRKRDQSEVEKFS